MQPPLIRSWSVGSVLALFLIYIPLPLVCESSFPDPGHADDGGMDDREESLLGFECPDDELENDPLDSDGEQYDSPFGPRVTLPTRLTASQLLSGPIVVSHFRRGFCAAFANPGGERSVVRCRPHNFGATYALYTSGSWRMLLSVMRD